MPWDMTIFFIGLPDGSLWLLEYKTADVHLSIDKRFNSLSANDKWNVTDHELCNNNNNKKKKKKEY